MNQDDDERHKREEQERRAKRKVRYSVVWFHLLVFNWERLIDQFVRTVMNSGE